MASKSTTENAARTALVWLDATDIDNAHSLFGLPAIERLNRTLRKLRVAESDIEISAAPAAAGLAAALAHGRPVVALDGAALTDPRLVAHLLGADRSLVARGEDGVALRLEPAAAAMLDGDALHDVADRLLADGVEELSQDAFDGFIGVLRRDLPFYVKRANDAEETRALERWMFFANYKGSTDILTKYVFPPLVWPITRWCAARGVHPNTVTWISILLTVLATFLFAAGWFWIGLACAYAMAVLDSVDGKLARVTLTDSRIGNVLDHGLDIVHPPFWYLAWAWGMVHEGAGPLLLYGAWIMTALYVCDRLILMVAKARFGRGLHAMTPMDGAVRSIISRRNTNLVILTGGLMLGFNETAFYAVVAWQGATALWHAYRTAALFPKTRVV